MDINCIHFDSCSGCSRNRDVARPNAYIEAQEFFQSLGISPFKLHVGAVCHWRCRAKLATRGASSAPLIGLFEEGSHRLVDIPFCKVHHPAINRAVDLLRAWITRHHISLYDEKSGKGLLRYIQLAVERSTQKVQLVLVLNEAPNQTWDIGPNKALIEDLWGTLHGGWHSLWTNFNTRRDNVIFGPEWKHLCGEMWLWEQFLGRNVCFHPASFVQANLEMFERLLERLIDFVPQNADLLEFYAGVGAIGLALVERCRRVQCVEIVPLAQQCFEMSYAQLPIHLKERIAYKSGSAGAHATLLQCAGEVVIVDPPRKGLEPQLLQALCADATSRRLIYISCGWESFQRDCKALLLGGWKLRDAEGYLFFPGSEHLETLAIFDK